MNVSSIIEPDDVCHRCNFSTMYYIDTLSHLKGYQILRKCLLWLYYVTLATFISRLTGYQRTLVLVLTARLLVAAFLACNYLYRTVDW